LFIRWTKGKLDIIKIHGATVTIMLLCNCYFVLGEVNESHLVW